MITYPALALFEEDVEVWPCWDKCCLIGGGVPLVVSFKLSKPHASHTFFCLPMDCDVELSAISPVPYLPVSSPI